MARRKVCTGCERKKTLGEFHLKSSGKYGRDSRCKECKRQYRATYPETGRYRASVRISDDAKKMVRYMAFRHQMTHAEFLDRLVRSKYRELTS